MKKYFKDLWPMYVISFVFCFMLFLYEPVLMFLSNVSDFDFGINTVFSVSFLLFLLVYLSIIIVFNAIYFISRNKCKKIYQISILVMFVILFCSYIQGNFLVGNLPVLDGTPINWLDYKLDWIISIVLWVIVIGLVVIISKKTSINKSIKYYGYASLAVLFLISTSLITAFISNNESTIKNFTPVITYKNYNKYSSDKNLIIFVLDTLDSSSFMKRLKADKNFNDVFDDFTYYQDAMSGHLYTTESIPLILTGEYYQNEKPISEWATEAYKNSSLFDTLEKKNYELDMYGEVLMYYDRSATRISNVDNSDDFGLNRSKFMKQELKYILFRYLPSFLKKYSKIEQMNFDSSNIMDNKKLSEIAYNWSNSEMYKRVKEMEIEKSGDKVFKFIHVKGGHVPYLHNKNFESIKNATYADEIDSNITLIKEYLNMLKENNVYDNSAIVIMADHGFETEENNGQRQNPILFVKGVGEKHDNMQVSNKPVHFNDLKELYNDLLDGKKSTEVFKDVPDQRTRKFLKYSFSTKDVMEEYETKGKALENASKTGKVYRKSW